MTTTFEDARVGDRVWSAAHGWLTVITVMPDKMYSIEAMDKFSRNTASFTTAGELFSGMAQCLFWDEIKFTAPPMPERVRYKNVNGFKVPDAAIDYHIPDGTAYIVPSPTSMRYFSEMFANNHVQTDMHIRLGLAYHDTNAGHAAATAHAKAWLGEGEPWTD